MMVPNASCTLVRDLAAMRVKTACLALAVAIDRENSLTQEARDIAMGDYKGAIEAAMDDPTSGTQLDGRVYAQKELQYLTVVCEGVTQSFCCRRTECMFFGLNHEWPKDPNSEHWACPRCGFEYKPFKTMASCEPFQFVLSMPNIDSGEQMYVPALWPDGCSEKWLRAQMEVYALQIDTPAKLEAYTLGEATTELQDLIKQISVPVHFKNEVWDRSLCLANLNPKFDVSLYEQRGYTFGGRLSKERDAFAIANPFSNWSSLAAMMGKIIAKSRSMPGSAIDAARAMPLK
jgi:hypothetical protein